MSPLFFLLSTSVGPACNEAYLLILNTGNKETRKTYQEEAKYSQLVILEKLWLDCFAHGIEKPRKAQETRSHHRIPQQQASLLT